MSTASPERVVAKKLVIADDSPLVLDMLRDLFEERGLEVFTIPSAIGLSGLLRRVRPDAIVLDLNMPAIRGDEAVLSARRVCPDAPIVLYSDDAAAAALAEKCGVFFVRKGRPDILAEMVVSALDP